MVIDKQIENKNVLFITTKGLDYIRNTQEVNLIRKYAASVKVIGTKDSGYLKRLVKVYWSVLTVKAKNYDVVFIGFAPQLILPVFRRKFRKCHVMIDFFISMYDTFACDRQIVKKGSPVAKIFHCIDTKTLASADRIVVDTKAHGDFFISEFGADPDKVEVLYLEADKEIYYPRKRQETAHIGAFTVLYFGSILPLQGVETVLAAAELLKDDDRIYFIVIGPVKNKAKRYEGNNIEYIDWLPQTELADKIAAADLCLAGHFNAQIDKAKRTIPGKAYIYEAMRKKMILGDNSANRELFMEDEMHYYVEMGNAAELAAQIVRIAEEQSCSLYSQVE